LIDPFGAGTTGAGDWIGVELLTQHELSHAQRTQHDASVVWTPALAGSTDCVTDSNRLNKMANVAFN